MSDDAPASLAEMVRRKKRRSPLFWVILISAAVHVLAGVIVGSWTIYNYTRPPEATFESPPPAVKVPPQNIEYRVQMQQMQRESARPQSQVTAQVSQLLNQQVSQVGANVPSLATPALAGAPVVSTGRRAPGQIGGGAGVGFGVSAVNFFGIEKQGERVVFIVDAGASMVEPERGDLPGYDRVKSELVGLVGGLSPGTFFNIVVFERDVDVFQPQLVVATQDNKRGVEGWIGPYWRLQGTKIERRGTFRKNYQPKMVDWPSDGGSSRMDLALVTAFEMGADLIFMITDGTPSVQKGVSAGQDARFDAAMAKYREERARYEASDKGKAEMADYAAARETWQSKRDAEVADRARRGLPPVVREGGGGSAGAPAVPGPRPPRRTTGYYSDEEMVANARRLAALNYGRDNRNWPTVNVVGYSADEEAQAFIKRLDTGFPNSSWRNIGKFEK